MNWKAEATEKLRSYETMRLAIRNLPREIERLEAEYTGIGAQRFTGRVTARDQRNREERMLNNIVQRQELQWSLEQTRRWIRLMDRGLAVLDDREKAILEQLYIYPRAGAMERLCAELGVEKTSIYRRRDRALEKFTRAMYGFTESN